jgi:hypothetical protein
MNQMAPPAAPEALPLFISSSFYIVIFTTIGKIKMSISFNIKNLSQIVFWINRKTTENSVRPAL